MTVTVEFTGSSAGVESVLSGKCDIGNSSRNVKEEEKTGESAALLFTAGSGYYLPKAGMGLVRKLFESGGTGGPSHG